MILVANDLLSEPLHPVKELLVGLELVRWHILVVNLPQLRKYWPLDNLHRFLHGLPASLIQFLH